MEEGADHKQKETNRSDRPSSAGREPFFRRWIRFDLLRDAARSGKCEAQNYL